MQWTVPRAWEGGTCIILGGGPSMVKQFEIPQSVVQDVYTGRSTPDVYSPYMKAIHDQHVIAVNVAYRIGSWIDVMFFGDDSTWKEEKEELIKFKGLRVTCATGCDDDTRLKFLKRDQRKRTGITTNPSMLAWNSNSGAAAINLAVHFGVKRIILFGFDMQLDEGQNQHWHKFYKTKITEVGTSFRRHLTNFPQIRSDLDALKIQVLNANPDSAIKYFEKVNFKDIKL